MPSRPVSHACQTRTANPATAGASGKLCRGACSLASIQKPSDGHNQQCIASSSRRAGISSRSEKPGRNAGQIVGRTPHLQPVHVDAPAALIGSIRPVQIESLMGNSLRGRLI